MDGFQLGKKLKEARLTKKMTQADVVGNFITRNMLSQIESGTATPSLRTLEYLANTLEIPIHYLIAENQGGSLPVAEPEQADYENHENHRTHENHRNDEGIVNPQFFGFLLSLKALYDAEQFEKLGEVLNETLSRSTHKPPN